MPYSGYCSAEGQDGEHGWVDYGSGRCEEHEQGFSLVANSELEQEYLTLRMAHSWAGDKTVEASDDTNWLHYATAADLRAVIAHMQEVVNA